jgi:hypothetical protein
MRETKCVAISDREVEHGRVKSLALIQMWPSISHIHRLKSIGGDLKFEGRGIYFDGVLGLDRQTRIYIGQSTNLRFRISQHWNFRHRRDNPSLHYHAVQQSIFNVFGILAVLPSPNMGNHVLPGMDCPDLLLNILEMWMCLVFRSLPQQALVNWLPEDMKIEGEFGALNIACPLDNGVKEREWVDLSEWEDPLVQEYLNRDKKKSSLAYKSKNGEEAERKASRNTVYERDINIQISGPVLLAGAAILTGYLLLKNVPGAGRR